MLSTQARLLSGGRLLSLALLGGITLSPIGAPSESVHAAPQPPATWLTLSGPWLCRDWAEDSSGNAASRATATATASDTETVIEIWRPSAKTNGYSTGDTSVHCTRLWHIDANARLISDSPGWVPNPTGAWPASLDDALPDAQLLKADRPAYKPAPKPQPVRKVVLVSRPAAAPPAPASSAPAPPMPSGGYNPWAPVPGHPSYGMSDFAGDPWSAYFGVCTWYAWYRHQGEPLLKLGNAAAWPGAAPSYGLRVGTTPVAGATVIFQPCVEGADGGGHAAHVEQVLGGGWFIISEMNFTWNGGGWGRVDWRYVYMAPGVSFIY